jgi:16S rRNA (guanine527-N7)-methyltransferase
MKIGSQQWVKLVIDGAKTLGVAVDQQQAHQFAIHVGELIKWNTKINLTTITDPVDVAVKHILDCIAPARYIPPEASLLDIGSGGGFPGIPLKIASPTVSMTLIDGSRKKISFLKHIIRTLQLQNVDACQIRAEDLVQNLAQKIQTPPSFDVIISRALSSLENYVRLALPLLAEEGVVIALKGNIDIERVNDLQSNILDTMSGVLSNRNSFSTALETYQLPVIHAKRSIFILRKKNNLKSFRVL